MTELCMNFFDGASSPSASVVDLDKLGEKVSILLNWSMGLFALGSHRAYAVYTLLKLWSERHDEHRAAPFDFFLVLYQWLDTSSAAKDNDNALGIGIVFGELIRQGIFSYSRYLQHLIAQGQTMRIKAVSEKVSHHVALLRSMPIFVQAKDLYQQRRIAICGDDAELLARDEAEEEQALESFKDEVRAILPEIFSLSRSVAV